MIDTVILRLQKDKLVAVDMQKEGIQWSKQAEFPAYQKFVRNPSVRDMASGMYFPRLTGYKHKGQEGEIKIEFSVPKLLYKNNLDELTGKEFETIVELLQDRLGRIGIMATHKQLAQAEVRTIHYSKNILLTKGYTAQYVLNELRKVNVNQRFDGTKTVFKNDGQSVQMYSQAHSLVFYDKVADLKQPEKRKIDRDNTPLQLDLFSKVEKKSEILRMEIRLCQKRKINTLFKSLGYPENPTFRDAYSLEKSLKVIAHYWSTMVEERGLGLFNIDLKPKELLHSFYKTGKKKIKAKEAIFRIGLVHLIKDGDGMRELRAMLTKNDTDARTWYRLVKQFKDTSKQLRKYKPREWFDEIKKQITHYKPLRLKDITINTNENKENSKA
jgi:hypothetical protein